MYLSRLDLFGFKSFAHRTRMDFNDGLTCVIGPNGAGKSNIVDAIRWVLGEQRGSQKITCDDCPETEKQGNESCSANHRRQMRWVEELRGDPDAVCIVVDGSESMKGRTINWAKLCENSSPAAIPSSTAVRIS